MNAKTLRCLAIGALLALVSRGRLAAGSPTGTKTPDIKNLPTAADLKDFQAHPKEVRLKGADQTQQLLLTGVLDSRLQDLTGEVKFEIADPSIVRVTGSGRVMPLANGSTTITAKFGDRSASVAVTTEAMDQNLPINFANHIVPIFTKLGCNSGGCHGKSGGQNGFALSLLGFVPEFDFQTLVHENRGRRLLLTAPESSLLLMKATGSMAHGGGKRLEVGSDEFKLIRRWIAAGVPQGSPSDPVVTKISVYPEQRIIPRQNRQQFAVYAHYSDDTVVDVTQRAQYESNDPDIAVVDGAALVRTLDMAGEAAVMARYQGNVATFRATVPLGETIPDYKFEPKNFIDKLAHKKWQELGIVPSDLCSDETFIRRVSADITGTLPTPDRVRAFLADTRPDKRERLVEELLETPEYAYYFANRWADVLRVRRGNNQPARAFGTFSFHNWIRESIAQDKPYDQFAREILAAIGDEAKSPPTMWYRDLQKPEQFVDDTCQLFLGVRMACAQCHHHPYEKWSQDDYWGMAAFFGHLGRKTVPIPGVTNQNNQGRLVIFNKGSGAVTNKRTNKAAEMKALDGDPVALSPGEDPRQRLVDWMVDAKNPFFARAVANRYWAHFFSKGIVDPVDDMRVTNPPSNPDLLDALAKELVDHKLSLKHLVKTICASRTYQLSAMPNDFNKHDKKSYARYYPHRMTAEVLFDAVSQVTGSPATFPGLPADKHAPNRAIMLPDEAFQSYFLDVFGRPQRISACECERVTEANLAMSLHLLNSQEIQGKLSRAGGRADQLAKDKRTDAEKVEELFLWAFARRPTESQLNLAMSNIERHAKEKRIAYENIIWALINTKEFILVQ
ncbi:MAG: DUF1549 domain-containing protein [Planctomycetes bacterium]|nr:DUF1549 domain-containing protein [Planctomycetota bacterium]